LRDRRMATGEYMIEVGFWELEAILIKNGFI